MTYRFKTGCSLENLERIRLFIRQSLQPLRLPDVQVEELVLAMDEMCSNRMIHAHNCNEADPLEVSIQLPNTHTIIFEIQDEGKIFDINQFKEPELDNLIHEKRKGGLGVRLVKSIMDSVEYFQEQEKCICRLKKTYE